MNRVLSRVLPHGISGGPRACALALAAGTLVLGGAAGAVAAPQFVDYGDGCVVYPADKITTLDSLRTRCIPEQEKAIYTAAGAGAAPTGVTDGWVIRPDLGSDLAPMAWLGKTFATGPDGGTVTNRLAIGTGAWPADVHRTASITDGAPAWALNYAPSPTPQLYEEIREIVPGVWLGYSWWRGAGQDIPLLTFALAN